MGDSIDTAKVKKGLPAWVVVVVLAIFLGVIGIAYSQLLKEKPPTVLHMKKAP